MRYEERNQRKSKTYHFLRDVNSFAKNRTESNSRENIHVTSEVSMATVLLEQYGTTYFPWLGCMTLPS